MTQSNGVEVPLCPWSARLCLIYTPISVVATVAVLLTTSIGPRWEQPDPVELWHVGTAILLIVTAFITEICFLASCAWNVRIMGTDLTGKLNIHSVGDSVLTLVEYTVKLAAGLYMWGAGGGWVHTDVQAHGGARPVYFARFAQWAIVVPVQMFIDKRTFLSSYSAGGMIGRSMPSLLTSFMYVWSAWVMEVTTSPEARWCMFATCMTGHLLTCLDQIKLALDHRGSQLYALKTSMLVYEMLTFTLYAIMTTASRFGLVSSITEQCFYAYGDALIKIFQGAILEMIRNCEYLGSIRHWWLAALAASKDLENVVKKAMLPVFSLDLDGRITAWNDNLEKLTGLTFEAVKAKRLKDLVSADSKDGLVAAVKHVLSAGQGDSSPPDPKDVKAVTFVHASSNFVEISIPLADARGGDKHSGLAIRRLAMSLVPKSTEDGTLAGIVAIGQDLSEIAELRLTQAKKTVLMGVISHEIRSPLHGIMGLVGAMLESNAAACVHRQLGMVKGCASRLLDLVTNIMELASSEKRQREGKPAARPTAPVDIGLLADEVVTMTSLAIDKTNKPLVKPAVRLVNALINTQVPIIPGDSHKLTQLLYNLLSNACKFTERGSVTLSVRHLPEKKRLELDVTDTGRGISAEGQKRIFQPFEQEQNGDARNFQGIGLGLAVCAQIVEDHGGELRVRSEMGKGSTFTVSLPCDGSMGLGQQCVASLVQSPKEVAPAQVPAPAEAPVAPAHKLAQAHHPRANGERPLVLSVDDDEVNQEVMKNALSEMCELFCAMDGHQALKYLDGRKAGKKNFPDVVLLDIQMPGMDGYQVCEEIRKSFESAHAKMPIIMVSAREPKDQTAIQGYQTGTTDFLPKPFNPEVLKHKVKVAISVREDICYNSSMSFLAKEAGTRVEQAEARAQKAEQAAKDLQATVDQSRARADAAEQKVTTLQEEVNKLQNQAKEADQSVKDAERLQGQQRQLEQQQARADLAERRTAQLQEQVEQLQRRLQQAEVATQRAEAAGGYSSAPTPMTARAALSAAKAELPERKVEQGQDWALQQARMALLPEDGLGASPRELPQRKQACAGQLAKDEANGHLNHLLLNARSIVRVLSSRLEMIHKAAQGCHYLLALHPPYSQDVDGQCEEEWEQQWPQQWLQQYRQRHQRLILQLKGHRVVAQAVGSQLKMMENIALQSNELAMLTCHDD
mmetsp:Transcript_118481/g.330531  ORF Transcript_118481/g.330531 Transcript_118481/m.330531 type:complete len:1189 (-) Transcript_118481:202-3768(-)